MKITPLDTNTSAFAEAYRSCAADLRAACGMSDPQPDAIDCTWYLDSSIEALGCLSDGCIAAFILYTKQPYFIERSDGEILDIWVHQNCRRYGVGQALTNAVMAQVSGAIGIQIHRLNRSAAHFWATTCASTHRSMVPVTSDDDEENIFLLVPKETTSDS